MKLFAIQPGAPYSTNDVFVGYVRALGALGHDVGVYQLDRRWVHAARYLRSVWLAAGKPDDEKPDTSHVLYQAGVDSIAIADYNEPDWVLLFSAMYYDWRLYVALTRYHRVALVLTECPYDDERIEAFAERATLVFTNERTSVERLQRFNAQTYYLPVGYDPARHYPGPPDPSVAAHDVVFVGTAFPERVELLRAVDFGELNVGLYGNWEMLGSRNRLRRYVRGSIVDNATAAALYRNARVGLNLYRTSVDLHSERRVESGESLNPRAYELAACGTLQIAHYRAEADDVLPGGVAQFTTPGELAGLVAELNLDDRQYQPALALKAVQGHTYQARAETLLAYLNDDAAERRAS